MKHYFHIHTHTYTQMKEHQTTTHIHSLSAAPQRNWASEPKGLTVRGVSYKHQCNLMVQNLYFFIWALLGRETLWSASNCLSLLANAVLARQKSRTVAIRSPTAEIGILLWSNQHNTMASPTLSIKRTNALKRAHILTHQTHKEWRKHLAI